MARFYGLTCRGGIGLTDAPYSDFQAGAQAMLSTISVLQNGANFHPSCGLLGSYSGASLAKIVLDAELIRDVVHYLNPLRVDSDSLALDVIDSIGPGGNYLEHHHTLEKYRDEFLTDSLFMSHDYCKWASTRNPEIIYCAHEKALSIIDSYVPPPIDPGLESEIEDYLKVHWIES